MTEREDEEMEFSERLKREGCREKGLASLLKEVKETQFIFKRLGFELSMEESFHVIIGS